MKGATYCNAVGSQNFLQARVEDEDDDVAESACVKW